MEPTVKHERIEVALKDLFGVDRVKSIEANKCTTCGNDILMFRDNDSIKEYKISGMCQACQDSMFGT